MTADSLLTLRRIADLRAQVAVWRRAGETIGFVPTMGDLHDGHLALVHRALNDCARCVVSVFVNPIQFDRKEDLEVYPRDEAVDAAKLRAIGADVLFAPPVEEMYPGGFATRVAVTGLGDCLCGATRPGHMDGVSTVVAKLMLQALPDVAYFGIKDYQQLMIVQRMAVDLDMPLQVVGVETVRDSDGLALSSRNKLLTPEQRRIAPQLFRTLTGMATRLAAGAEAQPEVSRGLQALAAAGFDKVDYLEMRAERSLELLERAKPPCRLFSAAWLGNTRLIDNVPVGV